MDGNINRTEAFYTGEAPSLFWEMTVCQSLSGTGEGGGCARALEKPRPYGLILAEFLASRVDLKPDSRVLEVGGGYGSLMEAFLPATGLRRVTMVDLAPRFSALQKERLGERAECVVADVFEWLAQPGDVFDLVISNENIGDFPTAVDLGVGALRRAARRGPPFGDDALERSARLLWRYGLEVPGDDGEKIAFNLGALEYLELLAPRARAVFLSEHSADAAPGPPHDFLATNPDHRPRRIELKDHAEYSIRFDHLEAVARGLGYRVERLSMPEFLGVRHDGGARFSAAAECVGNEAAEVMHEVLNHVKEYECLLCTR